KYIFLVYNYQKSNKTDVFMTDFTLAIQQQCQIFSPFLANKVEISSDIFTLSKGKVSDFVQEILHTCELINQQSNLSYVEIYTQRLVQQFDTLKKVVDRCCQVESESAPHFKSKYRFAKNLHKLPASQQIIEYQKIHRALNEKLSWLFELNHQTVDVQKKLSIQTQIKETEYRIQKCLEKLAELND
ncbi:primosomal replication protein PriC, partial [Ursidibacter maritimus]